MRFIHRSRGMTLLELLVSLSIASVLAISLVAVLIHTLRGWTSITAKDSTTGQATIAMQKLCNDIRDGRSASVSSNVLTVVFPRTLKDTSTGEIVYDLSVDDPVSRSYYISGGNLVRRVGSNITVLGRGVTSATFGASLGAVTATLECSEDVGNVSSDGKISEKVSGEVSLRNF